MPVIGRLDGQVEEVLISPVSRRGERDEHATRESARQREESPRPAPSQEVARQGGKMHERELPVWLL